MRTSCPLLKCLIYGICYVLPDTASLDILLFYFTVPSSLPHIFKYEISPKIILSLLLQVFLPLKIFSYLGSHHL